jgi:hypothetical protein
VVDRQPHLPQAARSTGRLCLYGDPSPENASDSRTGPLQRVLRSAIEVECDDNVAQRRTPAAVPNRRPGSSSHPALSGCSCIS